jgi:Ca-activated chloride channel homolog
MEAGGHRRRDWWPLSILLISAAFIVFALTSSRPLIGQVIRAESDLVVLPVTVTQHGKFVPDLKKEDFRVYENGQLQPISIFLHEDIPISAGLVLDGSGSMAPNRNEVVEAAKDFLNSSNPQDQIFVVNFNEKVSFGLSAGTPFTSNVEELQAAVLKGPSTGMTALYDAISAALEHLALSSRRKKALLIITDGGDDGSHESFRQVLEQARRSNAIIYCIGIVSESQADVNPGLLRKLAKDTGGEAFFPQSPKELPQICQEIAHDLREQYTIGYTLTNKSDNGSYRAIRVKVVGPGHKGLVVRTRSGYYATREGETGS